MMKRQNQLDKFASFMVNTVRLIFSNNRKCQLFPVRYLLQLLAHFKDNIKLSLHIVAVATDEYNYLIRDEYIKSSHYIFVPEILFDQVIRNDQLNWANLVYVNNDHRKIGKQILENNESLPTSADNNILSSILNLNELSLLVPMLICRKSVKSNCILVSEELYNNSMNALRLNSNQPIFVQLQSIHSKQMLPKLATKATISILDTPNELANDFIDTILNIYFQCPKILYLNHTYTIQLTPSFFDHKLYAKHFDIISRQQNIYFQCIDFETACTSNGSSNTSTTNSSTSYEKCTIIAKQLTNLHLTSCTHFTIPCERPSRITHIDMNCVLLKKYFNKLKESILPFLLPTRNANFLSKHIYPTFLIQGARGVGKTILLKSIEKHFGMQMYTVDCVELMSQIGAQTEAKIRNVLNKVVVCQPVIIALYNFEVIGVQKEGREDVRIITMFQNEIHNLFNSDKKSAIILIALTCEKHTKPFIRRLFLETIHIEAPNKIERIDILKSLHAKELHNERLLQLDGIDTKMIEENHTNQIDTEIFSNVSVQSQGFVNGDLYHLYKNTMKHAKIDGSSKSNIEQINFDENLAIMLNDFSDNLGVPNVPKVLWSDIGGLAKLKDEIQSSIGLPLTHLNLMGQNCRRSGILLYGPPGTGKTLVAKAVATECNLNFLSVQGPELLNMYVGQSEQNVREVFDRARSAAPCVIFLDELDSLAPNRGVAGDSGGVMDRVVSQLLAEMDKMVSDFEKGKQIFILAATNRPDLIDSALLRPGRFDKFLYVQPCSTIDDKIAVLNAQTQKFQLANGLNTNTVASIINSDVTGADLYSICSNAWMNAVRRKISADRDNLKHSESTDNLIVTLDDFKNAISNFVPSITAADISYFNKIKNVFN